ncbi:MAG: hypothetical protein M3Q88_00395 [Pseudomonadota bacterium]|nr:hypothetical protein [Pseudomonadota bacterium]
MLTFVATIIIGGLTTALVATIARRGSGRGGLYAAVPLTPIVDVSLRWIDPRETEPVASLVALYALTFRALPRLGARL